MTPESPADMLESLKCYARSSFARGKADQEVFAEAIRRFTNYDALLTALRQIQAGAYADNTLAGDIARRALVAVKEPIYV